MHRKRRIPILTLLDPILYNMGFVIWEIPYFVSVNMGSVNMGFILLNMGCIFIIWGFILFWTPYFIVNMGFPFFFCNMGLFLVIWGSYL